MHFYLQDTVALTVLAPAARHVKTESSARVSSRFSVRGHREQLAYRREHLCVGSGIAPRGAPYRTLIYTYHVVEVLRALYGVEFPFGAEGVVDDVDEMRIKYSVYERGFAASRHSRHRGHHPYRKFHRHVLEVILLRAANDELLAVSFAPFLRNGYRASAREIIARDRIFTSDNVVNGTLSYQISTFFSRIRSDIDYMIGGAYGLLVVLYHDERIAEIA